MPLFNVLHLIVDDLRPEFMAAYGQKQMVTPNLDKLAASSLVFDRAYCQQAVCGPSRASFMTGRRPHHTLVFDNNANFREVGEDSGGPGKSWNTLPEHFKKSNFTTLGGGKTFHPNHPKNWDEPTSWTQEMDYFPFSYFITPNQSYAPHCCPGNCCPAGKGSGPCCPGEGGEEGAPQLGTPSKQVPPAPRTAGSPRTRVAACACRRTRGARWTSPTSTFMTIRWRTRPSRGSASWPGR